ncbi:hypothetical protein NE663_02690 [Massilicoli timonensis]|uniref:Lipoprotein n=1 Tax=Massilicoli timonensis TaxID=2015901 RepID=A0ABT1SJA4_9FIRM|nr:hypothetical protein [Massilicoli timonensis]MCQ5121170.1 hypothetical protein [Massilicoli timonensis]
MKKILICLIMMMFLVGCQNAHESNSKTNTKDVINQEEISDKKETKTNADKKDGETKDVEKSKNTTNQTKVKTSSNEQSRSKTKPIESEVDNKSDYKPSQDPNNNSQVEPPVPDSPQEKPESKPSEEQKPTPAPPICNDAIPQGAFRTEQEAASYAQGVLMDNMLNGDGSLSGYELEWLQTECGTTYYTVKIY